jgi:hypothetical protein
MDPSLIKRIQRVDHRHPSKEEKRASSSITSFKELMKEKKEKNPKQGTVFDLASAPFPHTPLVADASNPSSFSISAISFDKVATNIREFIVTEANNGISSTMIILETENSSSPLNHMQVEIQHYDTNPQSFIINFTSYPESVDLITKNLHFLQVALQKQLSEFQIHIFPPSLYVFEKKSSRSRNVRVNEKSKMTAVSSPYSKTCL